ncbi:MAG: hypothetical protein JW787_13180 [Sedimentisphaerales bacterium]|nr:hypothetical protein [Sedimentisphaerales bacterium]
MFIELFIEGINENEILAEMSDNTLLTAKLHISHIYNKLHVNNKLAVVLKIIDDLKLLDFSIKDPPKSLIESFKARYNLTNRETELLKILCNSVIKRKEIAEKMNLRSDSIHTYTINIYRKTYTNNKLSLVTKFIEEAKNPSLKNAGDFCDEVSDSHARAENSSPDFDSDQ